MKYTKVQKLSIIFSAFMLAVSAVPALAQEAVDIDASTDITLSDVTISGESEDNINNASNEVTETTTETGMLIEIGNTTAENTTIIVRTTDDEGSTEDVTLEIESNSSIQQDSTASGDLSDWIAGDQITFTADEYTNSGAMVAKKVRNRSFKRHHRGRNGWIEAIRTDVQEVDVQWAGKIYTLDVSKARMVAGLKNPASIGDFQVGDRIRARVVEDGDGNNLTWDATIMVVLRRGKNLFMRVTRWVVPGVITSIPEELDLPVTIEVEVSDSKFYEKGDVNNLIGAPGTKILVDITEDTKLRRRYLGKAQLSEFSEGDHIRIIGRRDESTGHLVAKFIKNNSVQRLSVAYRLGKVIAIDSANKSLKVNLVRTKQTHKSWKVLTDSETAFHKRGVDNFSFEGIEVDDIIRVRGTANRVDKTVAADVVVVLAHKRITPTEAPTLLEPAE